MQIRMSPQAIRDRDEARMRYAAVSIRLGDRFAEDFVETLSLIRERPLIGSMKYRLLRSGLRVWSMKQFPYSVYYLPFLTHIDIVRLLHERRRLSRRLFLQ